MDLQRLDALCASIVNMLPRVGSIIHPVSSHFRRPSPWSRSLLPAKLVSGVEDRELFHFRPRGYRGCAQLTDIERFSRHRYLQAKTRVVPNSHFPIIYNNATHRRPCIRRIPRPGHSYRGVDVFASSFRFRRVWRGYPPFHFDAPFPRQLTMHILTDNADSGRGKMVHTMIYSPLLIFIIDHPILPIKRYADPRNSAGGLAISPRIEPRRNYNLSIAR